MQLPANPEAFFPAVRVELFRGYLKQPQVDGINALLAAWQGAADLRFVAYALATAYHETAQTMQPIAEYGLGKGRRYGIPAGPYGKVYYGRGFVQLTWCSNYQTASDKLGVDLVKDPDLALDPIIAAKVMSQGMTEGWFTGHKLADFFGARTDWLHAREIINGMDHAAEIAGYAIRFLNALKL